MRRYPHMSKGKRILVRLVTGLTVALLLPFVAVRILRAPSNERQWVAAQRVLPRVRVQGDLAELRNVRAFVWRSENDFDVRYVNRTVDLRKLDSVWYAVSRFGSMPGLAHSFLSFGFGDEYVSISVESRREEGESYSPLLGLFRQYELAYVIGEERDILGLRTNVWKEGVSLYPIRAGRDGMRRTFLAMTARAEHLAVEPEFYNTVTNSCISNIVEHVNAIRSRRIGAGMTTLLPGFSDRLAWEQGLIATDLPFDRIRQAYRVDDVARAYGLGPEFSRAIRRHLPRR